MPITGKPSSPPERHAMKPLPCSELVEGLDRNPAQPCTVPALLYGDVGVRMNPHNRRR
jgi:hypothetical protein